MKKTLPAVLASSVLALYTAPTHANATIEDGRVGIHVRGSGLRVGTVDGYMDGHDVRAQLYAFAAGSTPYNVTRWKNATRRSWGLTKTSTVSWAWKGGRTFDDGRRLRIVFNKAPGENPCAVIHR